MLNTPNLDYYLALLQLHIAVVGVVIAGVVALVQLLNNSKPQRDISLLVHRNVLVGYGLLLASLLVLLALGSWVAAYPIQAGSQFGPGILEFFDSALVGFTAISVSLSTLAVFAYLAVRARTLLDSKLYLAMYIKRQSAGRVMAYLQAIYPNQELAGLVEKPAATKKSTAIPFDPFQPIREYTKDNAFKYYDYGTADGLKQFSLLFDKTLAYVNRSSKGGDNPAASKREPYIQLARYMSESAEELFTIFAKTSSEKRRIDTVNLLAEKGQAMLNAGSDQGLMPIVHGLESIAKISDDDDEIIAAVSHIRQLCDTFLANHAKHHWDHVAGPFDEICLSVTRISETYYLQKNNSLKTVPIIGYATGSHRTVTAVLVDFFGAYRDLGDRYVDAVPLYYFEAIESVIEVLFVRLADIVDNHQQDIGFNRKYHELAAELYGIYYAFGTDAIEHHKPELLTLVLSNLRRIIKPAKNFGLAGERAALCTMFVNLAANGIVEFGDVVIKGERTISGYTAETLKKHATATQIKQSIEALDPQLAANNPALKRLTKLLQ